MGSQTRTAALRPVRDPSDEADEAEAPRQRGEQSEPAAHGLRAVPLPALDRVGVVLVSHSPAVAESVARMAVTLLGTGDPGPVAAAGGALDGGPGTSAARVVTAMRGVDQGLGVAVLADLGGSVRTVLDLLADAEAHGLPFPVRFADAPFLEGAVAAVATAATGGDLAAVLEAAEDCYRVHKR
ncbi:PTS-dependent dihydroxyacetone kinase phosphotransferase subunit DhaM [Streptacidiphilus sp. P02-A3a]|uniref:PTS-dependent dihydroxyacetone kinase phosphotransferase subunit DhaM n=1 Tax=Streptacidiphilus sp. P02-A3a TaxID=2704468 RepID=UPI0015FBA631|nr:PTS fructose transporter subunit IIA [Streptacidiphilus sp. P02-A3a]